MPEKKQQRPPPVQDREPRKQWFSIIQWLVIAGTATYLLYNNGYFNDFSIHGIISQVPALTTIPFVRGSLSLEQRAHNILKNTPLIDGHNDLAIVIRAFYRNHMNGEDFKKKFENGGFPEHVDLPRMKTGRYGGAFWSIFYPCPADIFDFSDQSYYPITRAAMDQIDVLHRLAAAYPDTFTPTTSAEEARKRFASKKLISPYGLEGLHQIGNSIANLRLYHQLGVRYSTLTWNCHNAYADAATLTFAKNRTTVRATPHWGGLSKAGRALVKEMNRVGMLIDLAHVSEDVMRDALIGKPEDYADDGPEAWRGSIAPPIFSHSSAHAICPHPRNVPDRILPLVKLRKSLIMVNFMPEFISCEPAPEGSPANALPTLYEKNNTIEQVVKHITYIGDAIGYDHVGIGTDFDGMETTPRGLPDVSKFPDLIKLLLEHGVSDEDASKVVGGNLLRVWEEADKVSAKMQREGVKPLEDELKVLFPGVGRDEIENVH